MLRDPKDHGDDVIVISKTRAFPMVLLVTILACSYYLSVTTTCQSMGQLAQSRFTLLPTAATTRSTTNSTFTSPNPSCQAKLDQLDETFNRRRQMRIDATPDMYKLFETSKRREELFDVFEPEAVCLTDERFGTGFTNNDQRFGTGFSNYDQRYKSFGDGPKFVCGVDLIRHETLEAQKLASIDDNNQNNEKNQEPQQHCLVYSVGSKNQIGFEKSIYDHLHGLCETHTFDPTVRGFIGGQYAQFHPWGFGQDGHVEGLSFETHSFNTVYHKYLNHTGRKLNIFKADIEGGEFDTLVPMFDAVSKGEVVIDQIQFEVHVQNYWNNSYHFERINRIFVAADKAKFRIFHKERNHWGCQGYFCLEYALVSEDFLRRVHEQWLC